jgi:hypothetical protein
MHDCLSKYNIFRASENYINTDAMLFPGPLLQAGQHTFPFSFILPHNLPSSFEGQFGHVRYYVKVGTVSTVPNQNASFLFSRKCEIVIILRKVQCAKNCPEKV